MSLDLPTRRKRQPRSDALADALLLKERALHDVLRDCGRVVLGFSGGVDSAYLAKAALDALGPESVLAVTGRSPSYPEVQHQMALEVARSIDLPHMEIETRELENPDYAANPTNRCFHCKNELYGRLSEIARERSAVIIDGSNADDLDDYRPGMTAAGQRGVRSPLQEAGLTKADIRELSRRAGLPTWDLPASPCLASRIPYGIEVTPRRLRQIEEAEAKLRELRDWRELRVRHHGDVARLEVAAEDLEAMRDAASRVGVSDALAAAGFTAGCVDLAGYRRGALNDALGTWVDGRRLAVDGGAVGGDVATGLARVGIDGQVRAAGRGGDVAVIHVDGAEIANLLSVREEAVAMCRGAGFLYVTLALY